MTSAFTGIKYCAAFALIAVAACAEQPAPQPINVVEATIGDIQSAISEGSTTCHMVVQSYLDRIAAYDQSTGLNAITVINPDALTRADEIDAAVQAGETLGSLWCAPILVKDNYDTHDLPTTGGSIAMMDHLPPDDAFMVRKIREADAIVIAKTNMAEWAFSPRETQSSSYGITVNAYAPDRVPAGSSGGTASGTAASFGVGGMGSDTGNSIRGPSSHLALFGIRSTIGLTSRDGVIPLSFDRDIAGPMTRTVEDGVRIFDVVAGYDPADSLTVEGKREADYTAFLDRDGLKDARIGILRALVETDDADPEVIAVFNNAVEELKAAGAEIIETVEIANFDEHRNRDGMFCPRFRYDMHVYLQSLGDVAPFQDVMAVYEQGQYSSDYVKGGLEFFGNGPLDTAPDDWETPCPTFPNHPGRNAFLADTIAAMDAAGVDALIYPSWTNPPAHLNNIDEEYKGDNSQIVAPATGLPAVTVPMGYSYGNLPAGLQILGRPYSEGLLIRLAYAYEQATHHRIPPEGYPELGAR